MHRLRSQGLQRCQVVCQPKWQSQSHPSNLRLVFRSISSSSASAPLAGTRGLLRERINAALVDMYNAEYQQHHLDLSRFDGTVFPTPKPEKFGDYQCNICMPLAKHLKVKPRDIATHLVAHLHVDDVVAETSVAGPGFLNFRLSEDFVKSKLSHIISDPSGRLGVAKTSSPQRTVVDYSSPNIAKEMHVGHLRSTIIGDSLSKILEFSGHDVLRLNHVGDWGTQFGMLIEYLKLKHPDIIENQKARPSEEFEAKIGDLVNFYKKARLQFDSDESFRNASRARVVQLQKQATNSPRDSSACVGASDIMEDSDSDSDSHDETIALWREICEISRREFSETYQQLGIKGLTERGESYYNSMLPEVVELCLEMNLASVSDGAVCIFPDDHDNDNDNDDGGGGGGAERGGGGDTAAPPPLMIQKSGGGYLYASTDLAALLHRVWAERASRLLYVTDSSQAEHFRMVFAAARRAGMDGGAGVGGDEMAARMRAVCGGVAALGSSDDSDGDSDSGSSLSSRKGGAAELVHVGFGLVLGADGKKLKSRAGETLRLRELLHIAVETAREELLRRKEGQGQQALGRRVLSEEEICIAAKAIGLGAVKYADLSMNREGTYKFSYEKMLSMSGNTAPYLLYAYARIRGIQRQGLAAMQQKQSAEAEEVEVEVERGRVEEVSANSLDLGTKAELQLAKHLIRFQEVLLEVERTLLPNKLCDYLYELSIRFNVFYESCSVLHAESDAQQTSRLHMCNVTADTLKLGLNLLGLETVDKL